MTFESVRKPTPDNRRRVGTILHAGFVADTEGATALKPDTQVTALMADDGRLYVETHGKLFVATKAGMEPVDKPERRVTQDLNDAREIYSERSSG